MTFLDQEFLPWGIPEDARKRDYLSTLPLEILLNIIQILPVKALGRTARLSRFFYGLATPGLYKKDACGGWPQSILWAASYIPDTEATERLIKKMFDLAVRYDGNVNRVYQLCDSASFTPLHLAAAKGNRVAVEKLLQLGADPNALGQYLLNNPILSTRRRELESRMPNNSIIVVSRHSKWRPLFIPFLREDKKIIRLLLKYGASPVLAVPIEDTTASAVDPGTINILHILSARQREEFTNDAKLRLYFRDYPELINVPMMAGLTPLFFSLECGNEIAFKEIMAHGGNIEDMDQTGRTPLMQAVIHYCNTKDEDVRQRYKEIIEHMIKTCSAKVGDFSNVGVLETPLICAIKAIPTLLPTDWKPLIRVVTEIINLLTSYGADINEISNTGLTLLHVLCEAICDNKQPGPLLSLFNTLVENGANPNIPSHNGRSILGTCIIKYHCRPTRFYKLLLKLGASLVAQEVGAVFAKWAECYGFPEPFDMVQYKNHITQFAIDALYETAFVEDDKLFRLLQKHFPYTTIAERVASEALLTLEDYPEPFHLALELKCFNGRYIHCSGNSLLHSIVDRLEKYPKYKDIDARTDAYNVLRRSAPLSLKHMNSQGKTPLQKLYDLRQERDCPILRLFLHDLEVIWGNMKKEAEQQGGDKKLSKKDWIGVLESAFKSIIP
ncbi:ankyrin repeat-containing domain protein [Trichoderma sp. SZMC 28015]